MKYYIGDLHFGHKNVIKHDGRPFETVEEMDDTLIKYWNSIVTNTDDVYIAGDFAYRNNQIGRDASWYLRQLRGKKHLIIGNHDNKLVNDKDACRYLESIEHMTYVKDNGRDVYICHYPMAEWNGFFRGSYHVYGHVHNNLNESYYFLKKYERALNAGCMINNFIPVTLDQLIINNQNFKLAN